MKVLGVVRIVRIKGSSALQSTIIELRGQLRGRVLAHCFSIENSENDAFRSDGEKSERCEHERRPIRLDLPSSAAYFRS